MFAIYDKFDGTYHQGNGDWERAKATAERYATEDEARKALDDVDNDEWLRDRLTIVAV